MNNKNRYNTIIKSEWEIRVGLCCWSISQVFICYQVTAKNIYTDKNRFQISPQNVIPIQSQIFLAKRRLSGW